VHTIGPPVSDRKDNIALGQTGRFALTVKETVILMPRAQWTLSERAETVTYRYKYHAETFAEDSFAPAVQ
jgi:hypothetical protein